MRLAVLASLLLVVPAVGRAQPAGGAAGRGRSSARSATRVPAGGITVDGALGDEVWRLAEPVTDFVQKEPTQGGAPTDDMEVRFAYDDRAFYVGARMCEPQRQRHPGAARPPRQRRPRPSTSWSRSTRSSIAARRSCFGVTASGVRLDRFHATDAEDTFDATYDLVWEAADRRSTPTAGPPRCGFPFAQLRFNPEDELTWGLNVQRFRPTLNEEDTWVLIPRTVRAWSSRFGDLRGIAEVPSNRAARAAALRRRRVDALSASRAPAIRSRRGQS